MKKKKLQLHTTFAGAAEGAVGAAFTISSGSALQDAIGPELEGGRSNGAVISPLVTLMLPISFQENEWFVFTVPDFFFQEYEWFVFTVSDFSRAVISWNYYL